MSVSDRLFKLRSTLATLAVDAYVITGADPHLSEYLAEHWKFREYMSNFTGSAGTVVITGEEAGLWTDSRYFLQAEKELHDTGIDLYRMGESDTPDYKDWLISKLAPGSVIGVNGKTMSLDEYRNLSGKLKKADIRLDTKLFIEDDVWEGRIPVPEDEIFELSTEYTGLSRVEKIEIVRQEMKKNNATHYVVGALDEIAWFLNFRGQDIDYNPVFHAYLVISQNNVNLFVDPHKLTSAIGKQLSKENIKVFLYDDFYDFLKDIPTLSTVYIDPQRTNSSIYNFLPSQTTKIEKIGIITSLKGQKNTTEVLNIKKAMVKDGIAMVKFLHWLTKEVGQSSLTELSAANKLREYRAEQDHYKGDSFNTISGYGPNGAIVHYAVSEESALPLQPKGLFLIDSGGQYYEGTTDITRTVALGPLTEEEKRDFTLVLKGHIGLAVAKFPRGTRGVHLDILARQALWNEGLNYGHGTGHGIGHFLNVHEGPQSIRPQDNGVVMEEGMISSNEPGLYRSGKHGIRTENLILTIKDQETEFGDFLKFETLTLCPIDLNAIDATLLSTKEKEWLNNYHQEVFEALESGLDTARRDWLKTITDPLV
ncbi:MAG: aminopeptidase P family protein [Marinilabiliaceae bacterium]|nr:aminopeptidase P family protein [Marinilabiliaceae bacterium]